MHRLLMIAGAITLAAAAPPAAPVPPPRPIVIAHRGASGTMPEHTRSAYLKAIADGADYIEPDLVISKDGVLFVRHENEIGGTTDVANRPEFAARKTTKVIDGERVTGWFTEDFTAAELRTLRSRERLPQLRPASAAFDGRDPLMTFDEVVALAATQKTRSGGRVGIYPETKHPTYFASIGLRFDRPLLAALRRHGYRDQRDPVFIQSFETDNLKALRSRTRIRLVQLIDATGSPADAPTLTPASMTSPAGLAAIARYADAIGVNKALIVPVDASGAAATPTSLVADAHRAGLKVHVWTFRAENMFLPRALRSSAAAGDRGDMAAEVRSFAAEGIDGLFSDFPADAVDALATAWRDQ